jgi:hypothetical protein
LAGTSLCSWHTVRAGRRLPEYCALEGGVETYQERIMPSTGDRTLDGQLSSELFRLSDVFEQRPGFGVIDDTDGPNAFATTDTLVPGTRGTVLFGRTLLLDELSGHEWGGVAVAGILAHEFGHILQFFTDYGDRLRPLDNTARPMELHADFLAGYYLGLKRLIGSMDVKAFTDSIYLKGDTNFTSEYHHGTGRERLGAVLAGYKIGLGGPSPISDVADAGMIKVRGG